MQRVSGKGLNPCSVAFIRQEFGFSVQVGVHTLPPPLTPSLLRQPRAILLKKFMMSGVNWVEGQEDPFEHVAGILTNVTRLPQARQLLLQPGRGLLQLLVAQLRCPGEMRKRGSAGAVKNCCVEAEVRDLTGA